MAEVVFTNNGGINLPIYEGQVIIDITDVNPAYYRLNYTIPAGTYTGLVYGGNIHQDNILIDSPSQLPWTKTLLNENGGSLELSVAQTPSEGVQLDYTFRVLDTQRIVQFPGINLIAGSFGMFMYANFNGTVGITFVSFGSETKGIIVNKKQTFDTNINFAEITIPSTSYRSVTLGISSGTNIEEDAKDRIFGIPHTITEWIYNQPEPPTPVSDNPYSPGGTSGTGGGNGDFDTSSDPVDFPNLPTLNAARCGLITMFNPTVSELQQLSTKMWSKDFLDNLTRLISDPIDIIVALTIVPVTPPVSGREEVIAGLLSTGVEMDVISNQYMTFSCGTYKVTNFYDAALDYAPYTKVSIYLPYIGVRQLNVDEIMGAELAIQYNIDLFSGACVAMIKVNNAVLYSFDGNVATQIPVSAANYSSLYSSLIQGVASIATTAVTGGATAPMLAAQAASFAVNAVTSSKPNIQRAGGITGANGLMGIQTPFLIFEIPRQSLPENQQVYTGYPSNITYKLSDLSGFTQISEIHLDGIPATAQELEEIERLLKEGVII